MGLAKTNYAILSSHRSGSTLLCNLLAQTNVAGKPNEYFLHWQGMSYKNYDLSDYPAYIQSVVSESQTANSVFGVKTMSTDFLDLCRRLETFPTYKGLSDPEKIRTFFPNIKFIYLTRRHIVLQAISWWKAVQSGHFHTFVGTIEPDVPVSYDFDAITQLLNELVMENSAHQAFISKMDIVPLTVVYEDFIQDMEGTVATIIDYLEIKESYQYRAPTVLRNADAQNEEWAQRYREDLQSGWQNIRW